MNRLMSRHVHLALFYDAQLDIGAMKAWPAPTYRADDTGASASASLSRTRPSISSGVRPAMAGLIAETWRASSSTKGRYRIRCRINRN